MRPQVHLGEADDGTVSYRNLSMYRANNEEEALNLVGEGGEWMSGVGWGVTGRCSQGRPRVTKDRDEAPCARAWAQGAGA